MVKGDFFCHAPNKAIPLCESKLTKRIQKIQKQNNKIENEKKKRFGKYIHKKSDNVKQNCKLPLSV